MKKIVTLLAGMALCLSLTACTDVLNVPAAPVEPNNQTQGEELPPVDETEEVVEETMVVKPSEFSEETKQVMSIFNEEILFFDYKVDESIKSYAIKNFIYVDGAWQDYGSTSANIEDGENRMALKFDETGYAIYNVATNGYNGFKAASPYTAFEETTNQLAYEISAPIDVVPGEEIVLWAKIGSNEDGIGMSSDFREADCTAGMAFTITFYDEFLK